MLRASVVLPCWCCLSGWTRRSDCRFPLLVGVCCGDAGARLSVGFDVSLAGCVEESLHTGDGVDVLLEDVGESTGTDGLVVEFLAEGLGGGKVPACLLAQEVASAPLQLLENDQKLIAGGGA